MSGELVLRCDLEDYEASTGTCSSPYYGYDSGSMWQLSVQDGLLLAWAVVGVWTIGLVARILIRVGQQARP